MMLLVTVCAPVSWPKTHDSVLGVGGWEGEVTVFLLFLFRFLLWGLPVTDPWFCNLPKLPTNIPILPCVVCDCHRLLFSWGGGGNFDICITK